MIFLDLLTETGLEHTPEGFSFLLPPTTNTMKGTHMDLTIKG